MRSKLRRFGFCCMLFGLILAVNLLLAQTESSRPRCRDLGIKPGILSPGTYNAITDVADVRVGSVSSIEGNDIRTGVTIILPHGGNLFQQKVPAAVYVGNGYGKAVGFLQIEELGCLESPIALTNTLNVSRVADAVISYMITLPQNENLRSINVVVGETNDGYLNDIQKRVVNKDHVFQAIRTAEGGEVSEGNTGAGTGTICFGFKGGLGTASRILPPSLGGYTVGVLVQTNFGGILTINGAPVGIELNQYYMKEDVTATGEGSCMIIVATDAPVSPRNLKRMAKRAILGIARTGGFCSNGSGDFVIAFSNAIENRIPHTGEDTTQQFHYLQNEKMSPLFLATVEAVEEAIYNSLFKATTTCGRDSHCVEALPIDKVVEICKKYGAIAP